MRDDARSFLAQLRPQSPEQLRRRALLPAWIRFFSWIFLLLAVAVPGVVIGSALTGMTATFSLYGLQHTGSALDFASIVIILLVMFSGTAAYGLLWGHRWGLEAGLAIGVLGLAVSVFAASVGVAQARAGMGFHFPLEPLLQIPFIIQLSRRWKAWEKEPAAGPGHAA